MNIKKIKKFEEECKKEYFEERKMLEKFMSLIEENLEDKEELLSCNKWVKKISIKRS